MLEKLIEAINARFRITCATLGHEDQFAFEPHAVFQDCYTGLCLVAGYFCLGANSPSPVRRWTEFPVNDLESVSLSQLRLSPDDDSRRNLARIFGDIQLKVE